MAWTTPSTVVAGQTLSAAFWNEQVRDNLNAIASALGTGVTNSSTQNNIGSGTDYTGLTMTETFSGRPVFVIGSVIVSGPAAGNWIANAIRLDSTDQGQPMSAYLATNATNMWVHAWALFTPSAGSHTVKLRCSSSSIGTWTSTSGALAMFEIGAF